MSEDEKKIILITDLVDQRLRKEQEIEYYEKELVKIQERLSYLYKEKTADRDYTCNYTDREGSRYKRVYAGEVREKRMKYTQREWDRVIGYGKVRTISRGSVRMVISGHINRNRTRND